MEDRLEGLCKWLRETKGITKIDIIDLAAYLPEYEDCLRGQSVEIAKSYYKSKAGNKANPETKQEPTQQG